jgi:polyhydroxyalkanoate synthase
MALLTTPVDTTESRYGKWVGRDSFDVEYIADGFKSVPGAVIDWGNKLMKPVTNYWTTYRRLWEDVLAGKPRRDAFQAMARWVADNPNFPGRAFRQWIAWMYKENRLVRGRMWLRGRRVDLARIDQSLLGLVSSEDVTCIDRPGGHIGLMAGSKAREEIWPDIAEWLQGRSQTRRKGETHDGNDSRKDT